jgi:hypothetical protein
VFYLEVGLFFSHLMRETIHRTSILLKSLQNQVIYFVLVTIVFGMLIALVQVPFELICGLRTASVSEDTAFISFVLIVFIPVLLYCFYMELYLLHVPLCNEEQQTADGYVAVRSL